MKKKIFGIEFDPESQPGFQTRNTSLDSLIGPGIQDSKDKSQKKPTSKGHFRKHVNSMKVQELTPSIRLRKKGLL